MIFFRLKSPQVAACHPMAAMAPHHYCRPRLVPVPALEWPGSMVAPQRQPQAPEKAETERNFGNR